MANCGLPNEDEKSTHEIGEGERCGGVEAGIEM